MKFLYLNMPAHGHVNPTLPLVRELTAQGHAVTYFNTARFQDAIVSAGAEFAEYPNSELFNSLEAENPFELAFHLWAAADGIMPFLQNYVADGCDAIVHDSLCVWGRLLAKTTGLKSVCTVTTFAMNERIISDLTDFPLSVLKSAWQGRAYLLPLWRLRDSTSRKYGVPAPSLASDISNPGDLNIVFTSREFQPDSDALGPEYVFAGPSIASSTLPDSESASSNQKERIYISLGTLRNNRLDFFAKCIQELGDLEVPVSISVGSRIDTSQLPPAPGHFHLSNFLPQIDILKNSRLFVTHGGMNSVNEGLYFGVPLLLFPQTEEQSMVARRVEKLGAGIILDESDLKSTYRFREKVERLLSEESFRRTALRIGEGLKGSGGPRLAAAKIVELVGL